MSAPTNETAMEHANHGAQEKPDYHGHPNYLATWGILVAIFLVSLGLGYLGHSTAAVAGIFVLAAVKAYFVLGNFMHLRWEPRALAGLVAFALLCLVFFYVGVLPDIVYVKLELAK